MSFTVTILEEITLEQVDVGDPSTKQVERYRQTVDDLDIPAVTALVNRKKRVRRAKAEKVAT